MNEEIQVRLLCNNQSCKAEPLEYKGTIKKYQLGLLSIWFHSFHEGHKFSYWEDGQLVLGKGDMRE